MIFNVSNRVRISTYFSKNYDKKIFLKIYLCNIILNENYKIKKQLQKYLIVEKCVKNGWTILPIQISYMNFL